MNTPNPITYNQSVIDQAMLIHEQCMTHCCDTDTTIYDMWNAQREYHITICTAAALAARDYHAFINRFNTHTLPLREFIERKRIAATITF